jgi:hypothetical protein
MDMSSHRDDDEPDAAADAFARLEGEVAMMRRAVERLSTEKADIDVPDYSDTLGEMARHLDTLSTATAALSRKPAMDLTPETMAQRIQQVARQAHESDQARISAAEQRYDKAAYELRGIIGTIRAVREQREYLLWTLCGGMFLGCLLWAILPGMIARALPESWHMPEKIATRVLREPSIWEGGVRLLRTGSPQAWRAISDAAEMRQQNREKIEACEKAAHKAQKPVRCTIKVRRSIKP